MLDERTKQNNKYSVRLNNWDGQGKVNLLLRSHWLPWLSAYNTIIEFPGKLLWVRVHSTSTVSATHCDGGGILPILFLSHQAFIISPLLINYSCRLLHLLRITHTLILHQTSPDLTSLLDLITRWTVLFIKSETLPWTLFITVFRELQTQNFISAFLLLIHSHFWLLTCSVILSGIVWAFVTPMIKMNSLNNNPYIGLHLNGESLSVLREGSKWMLPLHKFLFSDPCFSFQIQFVCRQKCIKTDHDTTSIQCNKLLYSY